MGDMAAFTKNYPVFGASDFLGLFPEPSVSMPGSDSVLVDADGVRDDSDQVNPNRVSLKLEVSWTEHSHIIGREGRSIKTVSTRTNCHIHFPDSNRFSETEKCNQVSIAGEPQSVETARAQVRTLSPIIFAFEVPFATEIQSILESRPSQQMQFIQNNYNVQIIVRNKGRPGTVALVKGNSWDLEKVKMATRSLMIHLCQAESEVMMYMEISPHYHSTVLGNNGASHVRNIMAATGTMIVWPNLADTSLHPLRKSTFVISGPIEDVYRAREMLIGSLPLILMSDLPSGHEIELELVQNVMTSLQVMVSTRPKNKNGVLHRTLVIRGVERHAGRLFEARRILLGLPEEARVYVHIPETYHVPPIPKSIPLQQAMQMHPMSLPLPNMARFSPEPAGAGGLLGWYPPSHTPCPTPHLQSPYVHPHGHLPYPYLTPMTENAKLMAHLGGWVPSPERRTNSSSTTSRHQTTPSGQDMSAGLDYWNSFGTNEKLDSSSFLKRSGNGTGADSGTGTNSLSSSSYSLFSSSSNSATSVSPTHTVSFGKPTYGPVKLNSVGSFFEASAGDSLAAEYNARKALASRVMSQDVGPEVPRYPTASWSGMGFSKSHNAALLGSLTRAGVLFGMSSGEDAAAGKDQGNKYQLGQQEQCPTAGAAAATSGSSGEDISGESKSMSPGEPKQDPNRSSVTSSGRGASYSVGSMSSLPSEANSSMVSSQTLMSPSFGGGSSGVPPGWRNSWSDLDGDEASDMWFKKSGFGTPPAGGEKKQQRDASTPVAELATDIAGMILGNQQQAKPIDPNNNSDVKNNQPATPSPADPDGTAGQQQQQAPTSFVTSRPQQTSTGSHVSFSTSNVMDDVIPFPRQAASRCNDLYEVLAKLNLSKYIEVFSGQDVDLATFLTLTEDDLSRLGVATFGARRKILVAIQELRKQGPIFSGSVAVGAERRPSNF